MRRGPCEPLPIGASARHDSLRHLASHAGAPHRADRCLHDADAARPRLGRRCPSRRGPRPRLRPAPRRRWDLHRPCRQRDRRTMRCRRPAGAPLRARRHARRGRARARDPRRARYGTAPGGRLPSGREGGAAGAGRRAPPPLRRRCRRSSRAIAADGNPGLQRRPHLRAPAAHGDGGRRTRCPSGDRHPGRGQHGRRASRRRLRHRHLATGGRRLAHRTPRASRRRCRGHGSALCRRPAAAERRSRSQRPQCGLHHGARGGRRRHPHRRRTWRRRGRGDRGTARHPGHRPRCVRGRVGARVRESLRPLSPPLQPP
jgi:hypothetical protein